MKILVIGLAAVAAVSPATAQTVSLHPGEMVTLKFEAGRAVVETISAAGLMEKFDAYALWRAETQELPPGAKTVPPNFIRKGEGPPGQPAITADRVELTMRIVPGPTATSGLHTALTIHNGYASKFAYRTTMVVKGRPSPTDVCEVDPNVPGVEHWPYVIDQLDLSEFQMSTPDGQITCR